jgi:5-formyltetrahydrofolate cyclo-ligase
MPPLFQFQQANKKTEAPKGPRPRVKVTLDARSPSTAAMLNTSAPSQKNTTAPAPTPHFKASETATIQSRKATLRAQFRLARQQISPTGRAEKSASAVEHIAAWLQVLAQRPTVVALYLATPHELNLDAIIPRLQSRGIDVAAPTESGFALVNASSTCVPPGSSAWRQAGGAPIEAAQLDVVLLPGVAFGRDGSRLGQGGGWYDRALQGSRAVRIGVGFELQVTEALPVEEHDLKMQWLATECGVIECVEAEQVLASRL